MPTDAQPTRARWSAILWDLDGTITDSGEEIMSRISLALQAVQWPVPPSRELRRLIGPPMYDSLSVGLGLPPETARRATDAAHAIAREREPGTLTTVFADMPELLAELAGSGVPMAVASSKSEWHVHRVLDHFGLSPHFAVRTGSDEAAGRTHKDTVIAEALRRLDSKGVDVSQVVMVGDRVHDLEGAAAHGIPAIIVGWGYQDDEPVDAALARPHSPAELRELLLP